MLDAKLIKEQKQNYMAGLITFGVISLIPVIEHVICFN